MDNGLAEAYVDGELAGSDLAEFERRLSTDEALAAKVQAAHDDRNALRGLLKAPAAPDLLKARILRDLNKEDALTRKRERRNRVAWVAPVLASTAAAAALLLFAFQGLLSSSDVGQGLVAQEAVEQRFRERPAMPIVAQQTRNQISQSIRGYFRTPVRPPRFADASIRLRGWRPVQLIGRAAVELDYRTASGNHVVTVHMVNASNLDFRGSQSRTVAGTKLWVDHPLGFTTVSYRDERGIGYVFSAEAGEEQLLRLVASSDLLLRP
jgi:anti-sigma factor RsiW